MNLSRLVLTASLLAALSGCDALGADAGSDDGGGGNGATGVGTGPAPVDDPTYGKGDGRQVGGSAGSGDGSGGAKAPENTSSSTGSGELNEGGGGAGAGTDCETCCDGAPMFGDESIYMRVDDSSSFASPLLTRAMLDRWDAARPLPVRRHEFLNFYPPHVPANDSHTGFASTDGAGPIAVGALNRVFALEVAVRHEADAPSEGRTIALVVDTSPSAEASVEQLLGSVDAIFHQVGSRDAVGVYSWSADPQTRLIRPVSPVANIDVEIDMVRDQVLAQLALRDATASLGPPLRAALEDVHGLAPIGGEGTVVLISDGSAGVDDETITAVTNAANADRKVRVLGVGVGDALYYSDEVLDRITDASGGAYVFFDGSAEAESLLGARFRELSEVAAFDVRLRVDLPPSLKLLKTDGGEPEIGTADEVVGQNIGWGGTMTFHQPIEWSGVEGTECDALTWYVVRGRATGVDEEHLATGTMVVGDVFGDLRVTDSFRQSRAVMAAADALRGPTEARMAGAIATIAEVYATLEEPSLWAGSGLADLCETVRRACEVKGFQCGSCDFAPLEETP
jgi:hypothetical protein